MSRRLRQSLFRIDAFRIVGMGIANRSKKSHTALLTSERVFVKSFLPALAAMSIIESPCRP